MAFRSIFKKKESSAAYVRPADAVARFVTAGAGAVTDFGIEAASVVRDVVTAAPFFRVTLKHAFPLEAASTVIQVTANAATSPGDNAYPRVITGGITGDTIGARTDTTTQIDIVLINPATGAEVDTTGLEVVIVIQLDAK